MGGAWFPPCWLFGLRRPYTGAYVGSLVGLMADSGRAHATEYFPELLLPVSLSSRWATATPHLCRRPSNTSRLVLFSLLWGQCSFPWVPMRTLLCVCPPRVESLFPPVLLKSCNQIPLAFKVWFSRNSSSHCRTPRVRKPDVGLRIFTLVGGLPWYKCSPVCVSPTQQLWDLILLWLCHFSHLTVASPLSLDVRCLFWWVPVSSCLLFSS